MGAPEIDHPQELRWYSAGREQEAKMGFRRSPVIWAIVLVAVVGGILVGSAEAQQARISRVGSTDQGHPGEGKRAESRYAGAVAHLEHLSSDVRKDERESVGSDTSLVLLDGDLVNARRIFWFETAILGDLAVLLDLPRENLELKYLDISGSRYKAVVEMEGVSKARASALVDVLNGMMDRKEECIEWTVLEYGTIRVISDFEQFRKVSNAERWRLAALYDEDSTLGETSFAFSGGVALSASLGGATTAAIVVGLFL